MGRKLAVRDITLNLEQGKIYGLLGPNGSGRNDLDEDGGRTGEGMGKRSILFDGHASDV